MNCYKNDLDINIDSLNASMLDVSNRQLYETMKMLSEYGYVKGMEFMDVISLENSVLNHPRNWHITSQG
ncbi:YjcQ family protein [Ligilactobacillus animalis]|uniref:Uncharacterized protein n=2 Tax=Lactobacillaceae TaxID=33958 RepID=A0ABR4RQM5_9LACO|nr:YjcQ family protein [Ligilactobacillus animalis]KDA46095.1 hypothetical protein Lani381_0779 [Ligilactobacillus animalis]MEE0261115.1 YjcQ family protein [Ligilactobacillus animalis]